MIGCVYGESTGNFDELSHLHSFTSNLRGGGIHPPFRANPLRSLLLLYCSIGHPFPLLHWILPLSPHRTCLFYLKLFPSPCLPTAIAGSFSWPSGKSWIYLPSLLFSLSPINNLACLPHIPLKLLSVYTWVISKLPNAFSSPHLPRLLSTIYPGTKFIISPPQTFLFTSLSASGSIIYPVTESQHKIMNCFRLAEFVVHLSIQEEICTNGS